ncbi:uncharacterized protein LTR77_007675 [Saxophila tyrrhenica]|uniref:Zn(2)-C6 fungal-type domain-containing protein n=1 Tax=Saxophila tyrrhenica TaxID=1690608 RepID=A0AAV9P2Q5_9PEZI|nr:hypothetical protein LTR77_007675 [Saxophila tyrrhenica]
MGDDMNWFATDLDRKKKTTTTPSQPSTCTPEQQHIRLACQACQRKKIKCDRLFPCGQCTRSGLQCTASTRKPRARHAGKRAVDSELRSRISKLESLVESLSGEVGEQETPPSDAPAPPEEGTSAQPARPSGAVDKYMSSNFWSSLTTEVQALREALEDEPLDDLDTSDSPSGSSGQQPSGDFDLIVCPPGSVYVMPGALVEPSPQLSATLCNVFCEYVDRLAKVFHRPTLKAFMLDGKSYLGYDHTAPGNKLLKATIWFAATSTMSENQCQMLFGQSRPDQLQLYKRLVDVAMSQADLMVTNDFATLQALTVYIAAIRMYEGSRRAWTLTALAVRIAQSIGIDRENVPRSPYVTEIRRRLWAFVRFLDIYAALDRGTEPLIAGSSVPKAKNTNDADFDENSTSIPEYEAITDMSYAQLIYDALESTVRLTIPTDKVADETWQKRMEVAEKFEATVRDKYWGYVDEKDPVQRLLLQVSRSMASSMKLRAVRPLNNNNVSSGTPRIDSPYVLQIAVDCLRNSEIIQSDPETTQYRWLVWVQWHAIAVALAGLCSIRDTDLAAEAWLHVEQSYARNIRVVADARTGMLWKPIEKLYRKASAFRDHGRALSISSTTPAYDSNMRFPPLSNLSLSSTTSPQNQNQNQNQNIDPTLTTHQQQPLPQIPPPLQPRPGNMPTSGVPNNPMDLSLSFSDPPFSDPPLLNSNPNSNLSWPDVGNGDMSWMDFERMLEDMSNPAVPGATGFGTFQPTVWPQGEGEEWM